MKLFSFKKKKPSDLGAQVAKGQHGGLAEKARSGFFGRATKKEKEEQLSEEKQKEQKETTSKDTLQGPVAFSSVAEVIMYPRVTEKGTLSASGSNAYVFEVAQSATKRDIKAGVEDLYSVQVVKVHTTPIPRKRVRGRRGEKGVKGGGKKAYVYLKQGDTIEFG